MEFILMHVKHPRRMGFAALASARAESFPSTSSLRRTATWSILACAMIAFLSARPSFADGPADEPEIVIEGPILVDGELVYPEGARVPRHMTDLERAWWEANPPVLPRGSEIPPTTDVRTVAEYEPMEGILLAWKTWGSASETVVKEIARQITTNAASGGAKVYMVVDSTAWQSTAQTALSSYGVNMSRVEFVVRPLNSIWIRDYGPRYVFIGQVRAIVDHVYNRPRPLDDVFPSHFASVKSHPFYQHQLIHGGGNYHLDANGSGYATQLIWNENTSLTHDQIHDIWADYQNIDTHIFPPFPTSVDSTQHIDMWMQVVADDKVVISDWPNNSGSTQDVICDNAAVFMANRGYTVHRVPARLVSGTHYTYTNVVMCNNLVLIPSYTNTSVSPHNATALAAWQAAMPGKTIVQINSQAIVTSAGVMHCIVMHVPRNLGGFNPTAYLENLRGGETLMPGEQVQIRWLSDDDVGAVNADILLSTDGGETFDTIIASAVPDNGAFTWTVPDVYTTQARIRVRVRDASALTGHDESESNLTIDGAAMVGDVNCDLKVDMNDLPHFVAALLTPDAFTACNLSAADTNGDTLLDGQDIAGFVEALLAP